MKKDTAQITSNIDPNNKPSIYCLPLTVAFRLFGPTISVDKHWVFGDGTDYYSRDLVCEHTYWNMPSKGNSYDMYVEIGHYILDSNRKPEFVSDYQSNPLSIPANPTRQLLYLGNPYKPGSGLPSQTRAYVEPGSSVGFFISLNNNNVKISWDWHNADPRDAPNEIHTFDLNPGHVYTVEDQGIRTVTLTVDGDEGTDTWYFPVLVLPDYSSTIVGAIDITGGDMNGLFRVNQELSFYLDPNRSSIPKLPIGSESPVYVWNFYSLDKQLIGTERGQRVPYKYTQNGNYKVELEVWNQSGNTLWWTAPINLTILDAQPKITTIKLSQTPAGTWQVSNVIGIGFPAARGVNLTVDGTGIGGSVDTDGVGHFTTDSPIDISQLGDGTYSLTATSTWLNKITASAPFTIPPQANV